MRGKGIVGKAAVWCLSGAVLLLSGCGSPPPSSGDELLITNEFSFSVQLNRKDVIDGLDQIEILVELVSGSKPSAGMKDRLELEIPEGMTGSDFAEIEDGIYQTLLTPSRTGEFEITVSEATVFEFSETLHPLVLADVHEELKQAIPQQPQLGSDESSLKNNGRKHWIWCITAPLFTLFHIAATRSRSVLEELIGDDYQGIVNFDYFSANCSFAWNFDIKAQYCWAHLIREIRFLLKHPDSKTVSWAEQLQDRSRKMFSAWHRRDEMSDEGFRRSMLIHRDRFLEIIRKPPDCSEAENLADRFRIVDYPDGDWHDRLALAL